MGLTGKSTTETHGDYPWRPTETHRDHLWRPPAETCRDHISQSFALSPATKPVSHSFALPPATKPPLETHRDYPWRPGETTRRDPRRPAETTHGGPQRCLKFDWSIFPTTFNDIIGTDFDWLISPPQPIRSFGLNNLINIKS